MPYLQIQTNIEVTAEQQGKLLAEASQTVAEILGKPESYVMVALQAKTPMLFAGTDEPTAFLMLKSLRLPATRTSELSNKLCSFLEERLKIPKERVYIEFASPEPSWWGWRGGTF